MKRDPAKLLAAIQSRRCDAEDLRDAAHEAHHALFAKVRPPWDREKIHEALVRGALRGVADLVNHEIGARAVEWLICERYDIAYDVAKWADITWWETSKTLHVSLPTNSWLVDAITNRKGRLQTKLYADQVEALQIRQLSIVARSRSKK